MHYNPMNIFEKTNYLVKDWSMVEPLISSGIALFVGLDRMTLDLLRRHASERWEPADLDLSQLFIHVCTANWYRIR